MPRSPYNYFVYSRSSNHIHSAFEYAEDAKESARDLRGYGDPLPGVEDYRVYSRTGLHRMGIQPVMRGKVPRGRARR